MQNQPLHIQLIVGLLEAFRCPGTLDCNRGMCYMKCLALISRQLRVLLGPGDLLVAQSLHRGHHSQIKSGVTIHHPFPKMLLNRLN